MSQNSLKSRRTSIRLKGYDYAQPGMYFVTLRVKNRASILSEVVDNVVRLFPTGEIVRMCWEEIPKHFENASLDQYVIMPNHVHGIVFIRESLVGTRHAVSQPEKEDYSAEFGVPERGSLSTIVRSVKSAVSKSAHLQGYPVSNGKRASMNT